MEPPAPELDVHALIDELRTSEARFRAVCECAPLGIYISEVERGVTYVNPWMQRMLGRNEDDLRGFRWKEYLHPDDRDQALGRRASDYESAAPMHHTMRYVRGDGGVIWADLRAAPITEDDRLVGYVGVIQDVTEHRALQAQLVMAGRLASVGTLAAGVAHEVNTPLAVMLGNLEWLQRRLSSLMADAGDLPNGQFDATASFGNRLTALRQPLADVRDAADRVRLIMKDLSLFSRPEEREAETADLRRVLLSATRMATHEVKHRARLTRDFDAAPWVRGSEARLGQVFLNLLVNAAHAIPAGKPDENEISVRTHLSELGMVVVEIRDTGGGIPPDAIERIFDPYFTTKPRGFGTGLGLAICHRIVSDLGGRIEVESEPRGGTVFRVYLHVGEPSEVASSVEWAPVVPGKRRGRVLVVDDDTSLLKSLTRLVGDDHDVEGMSTARAALGRLQSGGRYDVVLCDLMMPDMSGMEFYEQLSSTLPELADQVIFLTGGAVTKEAVDFVDRVPNACVEKPFDVHELQALIAERVATARALDPNGT